ncbi:PPOX class F420-dependent oxidoreductase [Kutzneria sp. CA-103260]|uniref:PPOX class F420-dependent oxidoreductase n=1 Tax=Kutzneria sp. CA-103260 TaxID=2802641 RepID=UPI001BAD02C4|nr:PPOX class F420-dependent oxidoreductase [Kutzneria sp. CA-103260]QUQ63928.1 PPOX class F420-dependent oxidoreductase [Kutzneria sp. CA-103260]
MTVRDSKGPAIERIARSSNVSLTTFRKDGRPVATPVGGVVSDNTLYILSYADTGKLKRLRNNPRVTVAPCDSAGFVPADAATIEGVGGILNAEETRHAYRLMARKTPLARLVHAWYAVRRKPDPWVGVEVTF